MKDKTDKLLICAKALGIETVTDEHGIDGRRVFLLRPANNPEGHIWELYDPRTNDAQAFELLKGLVDKLGHSVIIAHYGSEDVSERYKNKWGITDTHWQMPGDTLNEAIIQAIVENSNE